MDTGASTNFVSPKLLEKLKMSLLPAEAKLRLADNSDTAVLGKVTLRLSMLLCPCYVTDLCQNFDVILGNTLLLVIGLFWI